MKRKKIPLPGRPLALALLLTFLAALTMPSTAARYRSTAQGAASAHIAKWDPVLSGDGWNGITIFYYDGGTYGTGTNTHTYNNSGNARTLADNRLSVSRGESEVAFSVALSALKSTDNTAAESIYAFSTNNFSVFTNTATVPVNVTISKPAATGPFARKLLFRATFTQID
jgi:hypothetical protein